MAADSKMFTPRIFFLVSFACLPLAVCLVVPADDDTTTTTTAAINTSSALPLRFAGAAAPSISTRRDVLVTGSGAGGIGRSPSSTLCLHRVSPQPCDGVVALKDASGRLLCWRRSGQIWLGTLELDLSVLRRVGSKPLIDLGSRVSQDAAARGLGRGLAGVAVHSSGRLFVSYYTNTVGSDSDGSADFLVVDELSSVSWSGHDEANWPDPAQANLTRVFSTVEPRSSTSFPLDYYGGQILFRPNNADPFAYLVTGPAQIDGQGQLQAKILRFRVGQDMPSGNGTVTPMEGEVYALVFGIPRRCAFDADRSQDLYCAILKVEQELVYLISDSNGPSSSSSASVSLFVGPLPTPASLVGGLLYRGYADDTLTGSYIYMDGSEFWWTPAPLNPTTRNIRVTCSASTDPCRGGDFPGAVTSFAEDADKNALLLATDGVYLVVDPGLCDADTRAPKSTKKLLKWIIGWIIGIILMMMAVGGGVYRQRCSCFNTVIVHSGNVNMFNDNNGRIQQLGAVRN